MSMSTEVCQNNVLTVAMCLGLVKSDAWKPSTKVVTGKSLLIAGADNSALGHCADARSAEPRRCTYSCNWYVLTLALTSAEQYKQDRAQFDKTAAEYTRAYAK